MGIIPRQSEFSRSPEWMNRLGYSAAAKIRRGSTWNAHALSLGLAMATTALGAGVLSTPALNLMVRQYAAHGAHGIQRPHQTGRVDYVRYLATDNRDPTATVSKKVKAKDLERAREHYKRQHIAPNQALLVYSDARTRGGNPKTYAHTIQLDDKDSKLIPLAFIRHLESYYGKSKVNEYKLNSLRQCLDGHIPGVISQSDIDALNDRNPFHQALIEKKAKLMVNRMYVAYSEPGQHTAPGDLRQFINSLLNYLSPEDSARLLVDVANYAYLGDAMFKKANAAAFTDMLRQKRDIVVQSLQNEPSKLKDFKRLANYVVGYDEAEAKSLGLPANDVLGLLEKSRLLRKKMEKVDSEMLIREIVCDPDALIFQQNTGFLVRHSDDSSFTFIGGSRDDWGQMLAMACKYLHDRGDPWRAPIIINGPPEMRNHLRGIARANSWRMPETGHTQIFVVAGEIGYDVLSNYRYNLGRGYAVMRVFDCDENKNLQFHKDPETGHTLSIPIKVYNYNGTLTLTPPNPQNPNDGVYKEILVPVPKTIEHPVHNSILNNQTDTPTPESYMKNLDLVKYGLKWPSEHSKSFIKSWPTGSGVGDYVDFGIMLPRDADGRIPDATVGRACLVPNIRYVLDENDQGLAIPKELEHIKKQLFAAAVERYDYGQLPEGLSPQEQNNYVNQKRLNSMANLAGSGFTDQCKPGEIQGASDFLREHGHIPLIEQNAFKVGDNGYKAVSQRNSTALGKSALMNTTSLQQTGMIQPGIHPPGMGPSNF